MRIRPNKKYNQVVVVSDIHNKIAIFNKLYQSLTKNDLIIVNGDIITNANVYLSKVTLVYFYLITHTKQPNRPKVIILKGNHEKQPFFTPYFYLSDYDIQLILTHLVNTSFLCNQNYVVSGDEIKQWVINLDQFCDYYNIKITHGWYNPDWTIKTHQFKDNNYQQNIPDKTYVGLNGNLWGSVIFIQLYYETWSKQNKLNPRLQSTKKLWLLQKDRHYYNYPTIQAYNQKLKDLNLIVVNGHWSYFPKAKNINIRNLSNWYLIDGGLGDYTPRANNQKPQLNVLDITNPKDIKIINDFK